MTVVICAYTAERWSTIRRAIDGTLKQVGFGDELIVVVDHNQALLERCRKHFDDIVTLPNRYNRGLSGARNTAVDEAKGSIVVFLDDDAVPLDGWLETLRGHYADNRIYGVGGLAKPHWLSGKPGWFPEEFLWVVGCSHRGLPSDSRPVRNPVGANMSFRKSAFDHVGGFVEEMGRVDDRPFGCEDTEFSIRLAQANPDAVIMYEPASRVEHHIAQQRASLRYFFRRCWAEGISKAEVARRVGFSRALSSERHYVLRVLPKGVWNGFHDGATGDFWGTARALIILAGLVATTAGYGAGIIGRSARDHRGVIR
jgi:glucosyl-dolichyl phosphate glucuronosyltransferase